MECLSSSLSILDHSLLIISVLTQLKTGSCSSPGSYEKKTSVRDVSALKWALMRLIITET